LFSNFDTFEKILPYIFLDVFLSNFCGAILKKNTKNKVLNIEQFFFLSYILDIKENIVTNHDLDKQHNTFITIEILIQTTTIIRDKTTLLKQTKQHF
jgi:hypothetical protein